MGAKKSPAYKYNELIEKIGEAMEKTQYYSGIVNGFHDGEFHDNLEEEEAERLAESWANDLDKLSDESNIHIDSLWGVFDVLVYESKVKQLQVADKNRSRGKMKMSIG